MSNTLRHALGGMIEIPQWFVWRLTWSPVDDKYAKVPCFPDGSIYPMPAQDPKNWNTYATACDNLARLRTADTSHQYTLGFYLTANTGYWFLDVDKCIDRVTGEWSPVATWLYNTLPGAAFEYSSAFSSPATKYGIHLFGKGVLPYNHAIKPTGLNLELYHGGRGIAFGLTDSAHGDIDLPGLDSIIYHTVCPAYFPTMVDTGPDVDRKGPRDDWRGPTDDEDLLRRAHLSSSMGARFGNRATFTDLFDGNWEVLHKAYVDEHGQFAESECDSALAMQLAFWTGCDGDRIERLMRRSALVRPKWNDHSTYLRKLTIAKACANVSKVLVDAPIEPAGVQVEEGGVVVAEGITIEGSTYLNADGQRELFKGCVYVVEANKVFVPKAMGFNLVTSDAFSNMFGNYSFIKDKEGKAMARNAFEAFARSTLVKYPYADRYGFRPNLAPGAIFEHQGYTYINTYIPFKPHRVAGDPSPFLRHVAMMLPDERDQQILLSYLAACVQHKGIKFMWCPVLQGMPGNGKSLLGNFVRYALGDDFVHAPPSKDISDKFNDWLYEKLFIQVDEVRVDRGQPEVMDTIKPMITDTRLQIQAKGGAKRMRTVCANFYMSMNFKRNLVKEVGERRFAIFYTAQQVAGDMERTGMTLTYMRGFLDWAFVQGGMAIVAEWLHTWTIPEELNPATTLTRCPDTSSEVEVATESRDSAEVEIIAAIEEGRQGFKGGWICWQRAQALFPYKMPPQTLEAYLYKLGYGPHPALSGKGQVTNPVFSEGNLRVRLYYKLSLTQIATISKQSEIVRSYVEAQIDSGTVVDVKLAPPPPLHLVK